MSRQILADLLIPERVAAILMGLQIREHTLAGPLRLILPQSGEIMFPFADGVVTVAESLFLRFTEQLRRTFFLRLV